MKKHIPNLLTSLNLLSGSVSIALAFYDAGLAAWFVLLAILLDFLDGFAARLLKAESDFGKQLDSLADVISFGLAPSVILYIIFLKSWNLPELSVGYIYMVPFICFLVPVFSALRLARFNLETGPAEVFYGLPTPANALLLVSVPLILHYHGDDPFISHFLLNSFTLVALVLVSSFLLVSRVKMLSLKFRQYKWQGNQARYIFVVLAIAAILILKILAIPIVILVYLIISLFFIRR